MGTEVKIINYSSNLFNITKNNLNNLISFVMITNSNYVIVTTINMTNNNVTFDYITKIEDLGDSNKYIYKFGGITNRYLTLFCGKKIIYINILTGKKEILTTEFEFELSFYI